jgi:hypothetical protein
MPSATMMSAWPRVSDWHAMAPQVTTLPKVSYENGQLSIWAENCTLQQVLDAVHEKTGTKVEAPFLDTTKISVELGPGDPVEIVSKLLYGIRFNYIILGSNTPVRRAERIIITPRGDNGFLASNHPAPRPVIPALQPTTEATPDAASDAVAGAASEEPKKEDADPNAEKADKKDGDDADKDKSAEEKEPAADDAKVAENGDATTKDDAEGAVAAMAEAPAVAAEPSAAERMANLPEGVNPALASLYPSLFGNGSQSNPLSGNGSQGNPIISPYGPNAQRTPQQAYNPVPIQYNSAGQPILPSNIPPEMWNLYPANLLDLIRSSNPPVLGPVTPLIPGSTGNGAGVLWNQGMTPPKH